MEITLHLDGRTMSVLAAALMLFTFTGMAYAGHGGDHHTRTSVDTIQLENGVKNYTITLSKSFNGKGWIPLTFLRNKKQADIVQTWVEDKETVTVQVRGYGNTTRKLYTVGVKE